MQNIRRLYLYAVSLVSLEVVLWGIIGLLRSFFAGEELGSGSVDRLAGALALILVGIPVFLVHWWLVQRNLQKDPEERWNRVRAIFLYLVLLITLIPIVQNGISLVNQLLLQVFGIETRQAFLGSTQNWTDSLVAIGVNAVAAFYFYRVLASDWRSGEMGSSFQEVRRLYRYIWLIYGIGLSVFGLQQVIQYILISWDTLGDYVQVMLANGLALLLLGAPVWMAAGRVIQRSLADPAEHDSLLRLVVLFLIVFFGLIGCLGAAGVVLYELFKLLLGSAGTFGVFLHQIAVPFSIALPFGFIWAYYQHTLSPYLPVLTIQEVEGTAVTQVGQDREWQRRIELRRLYYYLLAFLGFVALFFGLQQLLSGLVDLILGGEILGVAALRSQLAAALAGLIIGLPVWFIHWRTMAKEASQDSEIGDYARRSLIRRSYLFLLLFAGVLGLMISAGLMIYQILRALLGNPSDDLLVDILQQFFSLLLFGAVVAYHWLSLRADGRLAEKSLSRRYGQYPVLILEPEEGVFGEVIGPILAHEVPGLPVAVHPVSEGVPDPSLSAARAVILPADLASHHGEAIRLWLQNFPGEHIVVATPTKGWYWIPGSQKSLSALARMVAQAVRQLAERGQAVPPRENPTLMIVVYVFAGLFGLELLLAMFGFVASFAFR